MNDKTMLYMIAETSAFMMPFVLVTKQNNVIVIDGGRPDDMPSSSSAISVPTAATSSFENRVTN